MQDRARNYDARYNDKSQVFLVAYSPKGKRDLMITLTRLFMSLNFSTMPEGVFVTKICQLFSMKLVRYRSE